MASKKVYKYLRKVARETMESPDEYKSCYRNLKKFWETLSQKDKAKILEEGEV